METLALLALWIIVVGVLGLNALVWIAIRAFSHAIDLLPEVQPSEALKPSQNGHPQAAQRPRDDWEEPFSPEGWGKPDSEVTATEGDDYIRRKRNPPREDDDA